MSSSNEFGWKGVTILFRRLTDNPPAFKKGRVYQTDNLHCDTHSIAIKNDMGSRCRYWSSNGIWGYLDKRDFMVDWERL